MISKKSNNELEIKSIELLEKILIARVIGYTSDDDGYRKLRRHFLSNIDYERLIPELIKENFNLEMFHTFISKESSNNEIRKKIVYDSLKGLSDYIQFGSKNKHTAVVRDDFFVNEESLVIFQPK